MAEEWKGKGANMALSPGIGIARVPVAGRNFEYLCGEEPKLCAKLAPQLVTAFQQNGIIANAKHFINNEIEDERKFVSATVSERVRYELYYPPFEASVDAGVLSVMCSYNLVDSVHSCQNKETLGQLRSDLGFDGWVVTDWFAQPSTVASLKAGVDMEMPIGIHFSELALMKALEAGDVTLADVDNSVLRLLAAYDKMGWLEPGYSAGGDPNANVTSDAHNKLAREVCE
jgi:beta-glucosidase